LAGYGQSKFDLTNTKNKKGAIGYEYVLSKRTFLYTDYVNLKTGSSTSTNTFDIGIDHSF
jgi:predicted porin